MHVSKVCLIIIDGFGVAPPGPGNARTLAEMPTIKKMEEVTPNCLMEAAENAVGLPKGQQGASEPGHMTIGAGSVVWQALEEINRAIQSGELFKNEVLIGACDRSKTKDVPIHFMGIYSTGNVHGSTEHWHAMLKLAKDRGVKRVLLHLFSDGRDVSEQHFCVDFDLLKAEISKQSLGTLASLIGRWFAMDRDLRFDTRTKITYELLTQGKGKLCDDFCEGVKAWYAEAPRSEKTVRYIQTSRPDQRCGLHGTVFRASPDCLPADFCGQQSWRSGIERGKEAGENFGNGEICACHVLLQSAEDGSFPRRRTYSCAHSRCSQYGGCTGHGGERSV